jgi:hypothetical protein
MLMLTKMKIALVIAGSLVCGVAAAQGTGSGAMTKQDRKAMHQAKRAEMLKKFDSNKDGTLDQTERTAAKETRVLERFKTMDTDGNGVLSLAEFKAGKAEMRHARGGKFGKHHGKGGRSFRRGHGAGTTK